MIGAFASSASLLPGEMSLTWRVPAAEPSLIHGSRPAPDVSAEKSTEPPIAVSDAGALLPVGSMSLTIVVPVLVPSLRHSSRPFVPSSEAK
jgi:hypothetical protein